MAYREGGVKKSIRVIGFGNLKKKKKKPIAVTHREDSTEHVSTRGFVTD